MSIRTMLGLGAACVALVAAGCGESPEDTAHKDGKAVGQALGTMRDAATPEQLQSGVDQLQKAVSDVTDKVGSRAQAQVTAQKDHLNSLIGNVKSTLTAGDQASRNQARSEVRADVEDFRSQAVTFQGTRDSVANAFWEGVKDGYDD